MKVLNTRRKRIIGERVAIPEFEMVSCPTIRIADIRRRRFDIIDRAQDAKKIGVRDNTFFPELSTMGDEILQTGLYAHIWGADIIVSGNRFEDEDA